MTNYNLIKNNSSISSSFNLLISLDVFSEFFFKEILFSSHKFLISVIFKFLKKSILYF